MRGDLTDEEWVIIGGLLPAERGRWARPAQDNRRFLNGMLHVLRAGCPWRTVGSGYVQKVVTPVLRIRKSIYANVLDLLP